jgi:hypothetical protein
MLPPLLDRTSYLGPLKHIAGEGGGVLACEWGMHKLSHAGDRVGPRSMGGGGPRSAWEVHGRRGPPLCMGDAWEEGAACCAWEVHAASSPVVHQAHARLLSTCTFGKGLPVTLWACHAVCCDERPCARTPPGIALMAL